MDDCKHIIPTNYVPDRQYKEVAPLVYGNIPVDKQWATSTVVWKDYLEKTQ